MPQKSHAYAVGRVRVMEQTLLNRQSMERLVSAQSLSEVTKALSEAGWGEAASKKDVERLAEEHVTNACKLVRDVSPETDITDCFLYKYDVLNLKVLVKARALGLEEALLSPNGTIAPESLRRMVDERRYLDLPAPLRAAMDRIEHRLANAVDPMYVDAELDKAMGEMIADKLRGAKCEPVKRYFADRTDAVNLLIALRCNRIGKGSVLARTLFVPGGDISFDALAKIADEPDGAYNAIRGRAFALSMKEDMQRGDLEALSAVEKRLDDYLLTLIRPHRYEPTSILPLVGYLLAREREASAVRLVVTAKDAHVSDEKLRQRLRELYA